MWHLLIFLLQKSVSQNKPEDTDWNLLIHIFRIYSSRFRSTFIWLSTLVRVWWREPQTEVDLPVVPPATVSLHHSFLQTWDCQRVVFSASDCTSEIWKRMSRVTTSNHHETTDAFPEPQTWERRRLPASLSGCDTFVSMSSFFVSVILLCLILIFLPLF